LSLVGTLSIGSDAFTRISENPTTAGIGPNQFASILGLGILMALLYVLIEKNNKPFRYFLIGLTILFFVQSFLSFSRGGLWTTVFAIIAGGFYLIREGGTRKVFIPIITGLILLFRYVVFPILDDFSSGSISDRFGSFDLTGRDLIMKADLIAFRENILSGVGPGQSAYYHAITFRFSSSHTEYTRLLAEHGLFGLTSLLILLLICFRRFKATASGKEKAIIAALTTWALLFMFHSATRLVAPSLLFGMGSASFIIEDTNTNPSENE